MNDPRKRWFKRLPWMGTKYFVQGDKIGGDQIFQDSTDRDQRTRAIAYIGSGCDHVITRHTLDFAL